jgi:DNA mismatch repair protein MutS
MKQYASIKREHPDAILLFRVGDFYETFSEDAIATAEILGITLTKRNNGPAAQFVELAGFPHHALDTYLPKLIRAGRRVAICDQLEDPKLAKGPVVQRGITELVTPGILVNDNVLNHKENNFLAAVHFNKNILGIAFFDFSTGEFLTAEGTADYIDKLINNFAPKEILIDRRRKQQFTDTFGTRLPTFEMDDWIFTEDTANSRLLQQFETSSLKGFGIQQLTNGIIAAGTVLYYLDITQHTKTSHVTAIRRIEEDRYVRLDRFTVRSLELLEPMNEGGKSLLNVLDRTITPMGSRLMKRWLVFPLKEVKPIEDRLSVVEYFFQQPEARDLLEKQFNLIGDLERIISKVAVGRVNPREVMQLKTALAAIEPVRTACLESGNQFLCKTGDQLNPCDIIRRKIEHEITADPPAIVNKGNVIADGVNDELDNLRTIAHSGKDYLLKVQQRESERTGIPSLKVSFNNIFGYYIEVRNTYKNKVPTDWIRKQTIAQAERYITEELKTYEEKILGAENKILELETRIFNDLVQELIQYIRTIKTNAELVARLDCLLSFAKTALQNHYIRPQINEENTIDIKAGRHPVIETQLPSDEAYIPNDVYLDDQSQQIIIITGPNMAGKSALLRQTALITLMAQTGSFVPAESAVIGLVDKIFTRVGASDNISLGESTFMVEMNEAADILNNLSSRSLILFDELGRGTSTYDGISIAWAIVEHIHENRKGPAKTLFATHYHELNEMEHSFRRIKNFSISVKEEANKVIFLRKLVRGGSEHSFGIHVAKMAGMPPSIISRSNEILQHLETTNQRSGIAKPVKRIAHEREGYQLSLFQVSDPVLSQISDEIKKLDLNNLTPIEALNKLNDIRNMLKS